MASPVETALQALLGSATGPRRREQRDRGLVADTILGDRVTEAVLRGVPNPEADNAPLTPVQGAPLAELAPFVDTQEDTSLFAPPPTPAAQEETFAQRTGGIFSERPELLKAGASPEGLAETGVQPAVSSFFESSPVPSPERSGVVDTGSLSATGPFAGGAGGRLTFGDGSEIQVSPELTQGLTISNPFTDQSLTLDQQQEASRQIAKTQQVAEQKRRERTKEALRTKFRAAERVLNSDALTEDQKFSIRQQMERELNEFTRNDPLKIFDIAEAQQSPEVALASLQDGIRQSSAPLYGEAEAARLSELVRLRPNGELDYQAYSLERQALETTRQAKLELQNDLRRQQAKQISDFDSATLKMNRQMQEFFKDRDTRKNKDLKAALAGSLKAHAVRYPFLGPPPEELSGESISQWLAGAGASNATTAPITSPRPSAAAPQSSVDRVVLTPDPVQQEADYNRAVEEVQRRRASGNPKANAILVYPNGEEIWVLPP